MEKLRNELKYMFIDKDSHLYDSAINLRYKEFYETSNRPKESIFDEVEHESFRIAAYVNDKVVGHARLYIDDHIGEITQVVVDNEFRGLKIGAGIMERLINKAVELNVKMIGLDARVTAVDFYKRFDFKTVGEEHISLKSGMPIIRMEKHFNN